MSDHTKTFDRTLSRPAADHLKHLLSVEADRRECDAALRSPIVDGRDALLCTASNLECGQPQPSAAMAGKLRAVADLLVEQAVICDTYYAERNVGRLVNAPRLRAIADSVRRMAHDDAELLANSLVIIADRLTRDNEL